MMASIVSAVVAVPDSFMASGNVRDAMPVVRFTSDGAVVTADDLDSLRTRTEPSMIGLAHANVLDESLRRSRETKDVRLEPWAALDGILEQIAVQLNLNWTLSARVHKLIVYEAGSFFREHRDAEHCPGHMLSLVVDLGSNATGGHVVFHHPRSAPQARYTNRFPAVAAATTREWASSTGAWAAWFASTMHAVSKVESGHRVVLTLDVVATPPPPAATTLSLLPAARKAEGGVAPFAALVWQRIAELLPMADRSRLSRACRGLHGMLGGSARLLASVLGELTAADLMSNGSTAVGVACRHEYLFVTADESNEMPVWQLKGRDRLIAEAMRLCGWRVRVRRVFLLEEFLDRFGEGWPTELRRVRIGCLTLESSLRRVLLELEFPPRDDEDVSDEALELERHIRANVENFDKLEPDDERWYRIRATATENDGDRALIVVPFVGVEFLETLQSVATHLPLSSALDEASNLWGNESLFGLRTFAACAVIGEVVSATADTKLTFSPDIRH